MQLFGTPGQYSLLTCYHCLALNITLINVHCFKCTFYICKKLKYRYRFWYRYRPKFMVSDWYRIEKKSWYRPSLAYGRSTPSDFKSHSPFSREASELSNENGECDLISEGVERPRMVPRMADWLKFIYICFFRLK